MAAAATVEWIVASSEVDALMLEYNLIQEHRPRFNVRYRDDKSYPYLALTVGERWPRAQVLRGAKRKNVRYFGPFGHAYAIRETLDALTRVFPVRTCSNAFFDQRARARRPCLYYDIGRCSGPCVPEVTGVDRGGLPGGRRGARGLPGRATSGPILQRLEREMRRGRRARGVRARGQAPRPARGRAPGAREPGDGAHAARGPRRDRARRGRPRGGVPGVLRPPRAGHGAQGLGRRPRRGARPAQLVGSFVRELYMERPGGAPADPRARDPRGRRPADGVALRRGGGGRVRVRRPRARGQAQADGDRRPRTPASTSSATSCRRASDFGARSRALAELGRDPRARAGAAADRVLRHLEPGPDRQGRLDGGVRGRAAQALGLPAVRDQGRPRTGRLREHGGDAPAPVRAPAPRSGRSRSRSGAGSPTRRRCIVVDGGRGQLSVRDEGARRRRAPHPGDRPRQAAGGGLLPGPARPACSSREAPRPCSSCSTCATRPTGSRSRTTGRSGPGGRWRRRSTTCRASARRGRRRS